MSLGFGSTILGSKAAMLCSIAEEVIDEHYQNQIDKIQDDEKELKDKIINERDELHHKDIAMKMVQAKMDLLNFRQINQN